MAGLLGVFDLRRLESHRLDCGYVLARGFWGRGLMTEALTEIAGWAMRQDGIWRIGAVCDIDNLASARVMEKAGLVREGILRRWLVRTSVPSRETASATLSAGKLQYDVVKPGSAVRALRSARRPPRPPAQWAGRACARR